MRSAVEHEIRELIRQHGRITFARFMQACLYSPKGGFYSTRDGRINNHFGTSPTSHPVFGALIARQLEQMWRLLGEPPVFHLIEVGSGDGALARSIADACRGMEPAARPGALLRRRGLRTWIAPIAGTYFWLGEREWRSDIPKRAGPDPGNPAGQDRGTSGIPECRAGCILCNELIDNFPVHRFAIQGGRVREVFVTSAGDSLTELLDEPSSPCIEERLGGLGISLPEGYRGEVNLVLEDWTRQISRALDRGFILTIDYGELAADLYSPGNAGGTLVCYNRHAAGSDPYQDIGRQDITCQVDFTSLMRLGERHGLKTVGYTSQSRFLGNLGFSDFLDDLPARGLSDARRELNRMAMMTLVDPDEYGGFKVLAQAKGDGLGVELAGFGGQVEF